MEPVNTYWHLALYAGGHDAVLDVLLSNELLDRAGLAHLVDGVDVVVTPARLRNLGRACSCPSAGRAIARLQVMGGQLALAGQHRLHIAAVHQLGERMAGVPVKTAGGAQYPGDMAAMLFFIAQ